MRGAPGLAGGGGRVTGLALRQLEPVDRERVGERRGFEVHVEDPVERTVPGVTQSPVNPRAGNTFPTVLRSLMRQDPNVIMVGEIRDEEVAQIIGQAAYTGHLVLSSMHTIDAAETLGRLTEFFPAVKQQMIRSILAGVLRGSGGAAVTLFESSRGVITHCQMHRDWDTARAA